MIYLPDTNIFIRAFHKEKAETEFLEKAIAENTVVMSVVVFAEFIPQALPEELVEFNNLLDNFSVLTVDRKTSEIAGAYRKQFLRKTKRIFIMDCLLAAQAKVHNLTLVTNNKADFPMKDIKIISP